MDSSTIKLIASDLDGTLLSPDGQVSDRTTEALRAVAAKGIEVVVATGRSHWSAKPRLEHVGCIRWMICSNGATVYDFEHGDIVLRRPLADDLLAGVVDGLRSRFPTVGFAWESADGVFHSPQWVHNRTAVGATMGVGRRPTREFEVGEEQILKLMVAHDELVEYAWLDAMSSLVPAELSTSTSGAAFVEVTAAEANKGDALRLLCGQLGIGQAETIAFGDHSNDLGMLQWVGAGYAMANGAERVRDVTHHVAPDHGDDGVAQVLEGLFEV